ncbi:hypothetical protein MBSD_n0588 [Mizugakiibacter sediminis]|uniref:Uncharacterized protein n=2 Tax=Mizugakiibacter sediminis TaxID=1475481 RepID=A0A0K8QKE2_9GAMM|nr:hypothetical protein MBSD_n0588 [Mizugakiibacter sediminis]
MRRAPRRLGLLAALACGIAQAAPRDDAAQVQTLASFQKDLVSVLALRADAEHLLGAALLARTLPQQPPALSFHALLQRAAAAADAGPAVAWAQLGDCAGSDCPPPQALAALRAQAADNAATWLLALNRAAARNDDKTARAALAEAAARDRYDGYSGPLQQAVAAAVLSLPLAPDAAQALTGVADATASAQWFVVAGTLAAQPRPTFFAAAALCFDAKAPDEVRADCLKLGHALEWGDGLQARRFGLELRARLASDPAQQDGARREIRDLTWQFEQYSRLSARALREPAIARVLLTLALRGGGELGTCYALLRRFGVPLQAPADWQPPSQRQTPPQDGTAS